MRLQRATAFSCRILKWPSFGPTTATNRVLHEGNELRDFVLDRYKEIFEGRSCFIRVNIREGWRLWCGTKQLGLPGNGTNRAPALWPGCGGPRCGPSATSGGRQLDAGVSTVGEHSSAAGGDHVHCLGVGSAPKPGWSGRCCRHRRSPSSPGEMG